MKLALPVPTGWQRARAQIYVVDGDVSLVVEPVRELPLSVNAWHEAALRSPEGLETRVVERAERVTHQGWSVTLVRSLVVRPDKGTTLAQRMHAFYRFLHRCAIVTVLAPAGSTRIDSPELATALLAATPDFHGERPPNLHELWDGFDLASREPSPFPEETLQ